MKYLQQVDELAQATLASIDEQLMQLDSPEGATNEEVSEWFDRNKAFITYALSDTIKKRFEAQAKKAKKDMESLGLLDGVNDVEPGNTVQLYDGGSFGSLAVKVSQPASRLDATQFETELRKLGVDADTIEKAKASATKTNSPAKSFQVIEAS